MTDQPDWRRWADKAFAEMTRPVKPRKRRHQCPRCNVVFTKAADLAAHIERKHG